MVWSGVGGEVQGLGVFDADFLTDRVAVAETHIKMFTGYSTQLASPAPKPIATFISCNCCQI